MTLLVTYFKKIFERLAVMACSMNGHGWQCVGLIKTWWLCDGKEHSARLRNEADRQSGP